jgi:diguanylate cyclase (GGDEF)-like protein
VRISAPSNQTPMPPLLSPREETVVLQTLDAVADAWAVLLCDREMQVLSASESLRTVLGGIPEKAAPLLPAGRLLRLRAAYARNPGQIFDEELQLSRLDGGSCTLRLRGRYLGGGETPRLYLAVYDLTGLQRERTDVRAQLDTYQAMTDQLNSTVYLYDFETDTLCVYGDRATVWPTESVLLRFFTGREEVSSRHERFREALRQILCAPQDCEKRVERMPVSETEDRWKCVSSISLWDQGRRKRRICFMEDRQEEMAEKNALSRRALTDQLTGLPNRTACEEHIGRELRLLGDDREGTMLFLDMDGFKLVNDRLGHAVGDQVLRDTARTIRTCFRDQDQVFRLGGDEFVVWMSAAPDEHTMQMKTARLNQALSSVTAGLDIPPFSASVGVARAVPGDTFERLYRRADEAMYEAKHSGKGRCYFAADSGGEGTRVHAVFGERQAERTYETAPDGTAVLRPLRDAAGGISDFEVLYLNPAFRAMSGEQMAQRLCRSPFFQTQPELRPLLWNRFLFAVRSGGTQSLSYFSPGFGRLIDLQIARGEGEQLLCTVRGGDTNQTALPGFTRPDCAPERENLGGK